MTCREIRPYLVDLARGTADGLAVEPQIARHVSGCHDCRARLERERILSAALRRAASAIAVPPAPADAEATLLARVEAARAAAASPRLSLRRWSPALAAALLLAVVPAWRVLRGTPAAPAAATRIAPLLPAAARSTADADPPLPAVSDATLARDSRDPVRRVPSRPARPEPADDVLAASFETMSFVAWPGAAAGPPLESGEVLRLSLPVSILPALGLWPPPSAGSEVPVDVLVGQDGFARAVRLAPE